MHRDHDTFAQAIRDNVKIKLVFLGDADGNSEEKLLPPLLYSPSGLPDQPVCYYFRDFERPPCKKVVAFLSDTIVSMQLSEDNFDPTKVIPPGKTSAD